MLYLKALGNTLLEFISLLAIGYVVLQWFQNTRDDPKVLIRKLVITAIMLGFTIAAALALGIKEYIHGDGTASFALFPFVAVFLAIVLSLVWTPNLGAWLASPITNAFDGGGEPMERKPFYSIAKAMRARGKFQETIAEIEKQLARFPGDFEGRLLLAEVQMIDLHDRIAAEQTIETICADDKASPQNITAALNTAADWHLKVCKDAAAARHDLQRIVDLFPRTEAALGAAQRLSHLGTEEIPWSLRTRRKVVVPEGIKNYGLLSNPPALGPAEINPAEKAAELTRHLELHPLDAEAREKLALIYSDHYQRLDLAGDQLEQLIAQPEAPVRKIVHWINTLADLQIRHSDDTVAAKQTLQRILERFPGSQHAELAQNRIELLQLELRAKNTSQAVRLGSYEQDIGLKYGPPKKY